MKRILVVDDNQITTDLVETILETSGYACIKANNAKDCLELIYNDKNTFDLILLDLAMPNTSGVEILDQLKRDGLLDKHRLALFTASSLSDVEKNGLKTLGALDTMKKPFTKAALLEFVARYAK